MSAAPTESVQYQSPAREIGVLGQSNWLDDIRRSWLDDGTLARWIAADGLTGITSNPAIFEKPSQSTANTTRPSVHWPNAASMRVPFTKLSFSGM
jgi:transaldolase